MSFRYKGAIKSVNGPAAKSGSWTQQKVMQGYNGSGVWSGNVITNSPVIPNGNGATNTASGIWTMDEAAYWANNAAWPNQYADQYFKNVSLLLTGDGTNGAQNNTFLDSSTNNFTITRNGNTTQGTFSPYGNLWSNYFNGSTDYLTAGTTATNFLCTGSTSGLAATFDGWVFPTSWNGNSGENNNPIWAKGGTYISVGLYNGAVQFYWWNGSSGTTITSSSSIQLNTWSYIAVTISGSTVSFYINGASAGSGTMGSGIATAGSGQNEYVGSARDAGPTYFAGYISNWRISNSVRSISSTPTAPLLIDANTILLTCQSNRFIDNSSNNFTLTVNGNTSVQRFSPFNPTAPYLASTIGGSGYFDGSGDYLDTATNATAFSMGTGDFTVEGWAYKTASTDDVGTVCLQSVSSTTLGMRIYWYSGSLSFQCGVTGTGTGGSTVSETVPALGSWFHFAAVRNSGTIRLYVNGVSTTSAANSSNITSQFASIGRELTGYTNFYWPGYLSNVRIVKGTAVYNANFTPPTSPLTAISGTSLLTNFTNAGIPDAAMMNDLETVGNAQVSTSVKKYGTGSLYFDGSGDYLRTPTANFIMPLSGDFTIELWLYMNSVSTQQTIIGSWESPNYWELSYINGTGLRFYRDSSNYTSIGGVLSTSTWYHVAIVRSGSTITTYLNGTSQSTSSSTASIGDATKAVGIGSEAPWTGYYLNGYIDDLRITKGYARYTANFTPPTAAFTAY